MSGHRLVAALAGQEWPIDAVEGYEPGGAWCWIGRTLVLVPLTKLVARLGKP